MTYVAPQYPVSAHKVVDGWASTGLDYSDYGRMSTQQHKQSGERRLPTPGWAVNDTKLRELLVVFMEERAGFRKRRKGELRPRLNAAVEAIIAQRPRLTAILTKLCKEYSVLSTLGAKPDVTDTEFNEARTEPFLPWAEGEARYLFEKKRKRELEIEIEGIDTYLRITKTGGADIILSIVYLYYRVGLDSVGVGQELNLKPPHVRQTLWRLHDTWNKLYPDEEKVAESNNETCPADMAFATIKDAAVVRT